MLDKKAGAEDVMASGSPEGTPLFELWRLPDLQGAAQP